MTATYFVICYAGLIIPVIGVGLLASAIGLVASGIVFCAFIGMVVAGVVFAAIRRADTMHL